MRAHTVRGNIGRAFLRCTINLAWYGLPVPMHEFGRVSIVVHIDHNALPLFETQERPRKLIVVKRRGDDVLGSQFYKACPDAQGIVGLFIGCRRETRRSRHYRGRTGKF
jgi:hypothetical protein